MILKKKRFLTVSVSQFQNLFILISKTQAFVKIMRLILTLNIDRRSVYFIFILVLCCFSNGCATLSQGTNLLANGISTLVLLPLKVGEKLLDFINVLPKPPMGVF